MRMYLLWGMTLIFLHTATNLFSTDLSIEKLDVSVFTDADGDGIRDSRDNCPDVWNPYQDDSDNDGIGDVCDDDDCGCSSERQLIYVCQEGKTRRVYCSALSEPNTLCGPCSEQQQEPACSECEADDEGNIRICVINKRSLRNIKASCEDLEEFFNADGSLVDNVECGRCACEMIGDVDTDGDGRCDSLDECPNNPRKTEAGMCGCDAYDSDGDWVCDADDICPGGSDKIDTDNDGIPDFCDVCPGGNDNMDSDNDGVPDFCDDCPNSASGDSDGDGVCDDVDVCAGGDDRIDSDGNGIPDACEISKCLPSGNTAFEWIQDVSINDYFNLTNDNGGYAEFTDPALCFFRGDELELWMTPGFIDRVAELSFAIFVDWNGDGDFDDQEERVYDFRGLRERGIAVRIPDFARTGNICARFIINYGRIESACDQCIDGEIEDYILTIKERACDQTEESFVYDQDQSIQNLNGGWGWTSPWRARVSGNPQAKILQRSLSSAGITSIGRKLGVLTPSGTSYEILREFALDNEDIWVAFNYLRRGSAGSMELELGANDERLAIDRNGVVSIGGVAGPSIRDEAPSLIVLNITRNNGPDRARVWINPAGLNSLSGNPDIDAPVSYDAAMNFLIYKFYGFEGVTEHYLDEIRLACTSDRALADIGGETPPIVDQTIDIAPNPVARGRNVGITLSNATFFQGRLNLYTMSGTLVLTQPAVAGLNVISTSNVQAGIYILEIVTDTGTVTSQLVIQS